MQHQGCSVSHCEKDKEPERIQVAAASGVIWGGKPPAAFAASPSRKGTFVIVLLYGKEWVAGCLMLSFFSLSSFSLFPQDDTVLLSNWRV